MTPDRLAPFDDLYRASPDPWGTRTRWYERRKRSLLLAALPRERYRDAYEAGCGTGHISTLLADRTTSLLATDGSVEAVVIARENLLTRANVTVACHRLPADWPRRAFDLIVLSEMLYFLDTPGCAEVARLARASAGLNGTVVACDWRDEIENHGHSGDDVHRRFEAALDLPRLFEYVDDDFVLTGWSANTRSVASHDGLRP